MGVALLLMGYIGADNMAIGCTLSFSLLCKKK